MIKSVIGITGHRPLGFSEPKHVKSVCADVVKYYKHIMHNVEFNTGGCNGADSWVAESCIYEKIDFNLYLAFPANIQGRFFSREERISLDLQILSANKVSTVGNYYKVANYHIRDRAMVDDSHIVVCFWEGRREGGTYKTIEYALKCGKQVFNALNDLEEVSI
jgi:hypothetical protein